MYRFHKTSLCHPRTPALTLVLLIVLMALPAAAQQTTQAQRLLDQNRPEDALELLDRHLTKNKKDAGALLLRSTAHFMLSAKDSGVADLERALRLDDTLRQGWLNLGAVKLSEEDFAGAVGSLSASRGPRSHGARQRSEPRDRSAARRLARRRAQPLRALSTGQSKRRRLLPRGNELCVRSARRNGYRAPQACNPVRREDSSADPERSNVQTLGAGRAPVEGAQPLTRFAHPTAPAMSLRRTRLPTKPPKEQCSRSRRRLAYRTQDALQPTYRSHG